MTEINHTLRLLGIGNNCSGQRITAAAVQLVLEDSGRLRHVTRDIYPVVGQQFGCSWQAVERSIRSVVDRAWARNPNLMKEISYYPITQPPTASDFLDMLADYVTRQRTKKR